MPKSVETLRTHLKKKESRGPAPKEDPLLWEIISGIYVPTIKLQDGKIEIIQQ